MLNLSECNSKTEAAKAKVVLIGASNLTRGISTAVSWAQRLLGHPLDFYVAFGHGRSYGMQSQIFYRELPGVYGCGLWSALRASEPAPTYGLITDIGNDVLYQAPNSQIIPWLEHCLQELKAQNAKIIVVQVPLANVLHATEAQFWFLRKVLFRGRQYDLAQIKEQSIELAQKIEELALRYGATLVEQKHGWYGLDPIHIKMRYWEEAWGMFLTPWALNPRFGQVPRPLKQWFYLRSLAPERRWILGREQRCEQPAGSLADGSRLFIY